LTLDRRQSFYFLPPHSLLCCIPVDTHYGAELELLHVSRFDSGVYLCVATNGVPPAVSKRVRLYVDCESLNASRWAYLVNSSLPS
jgi:hypothetical protein